MLRLGTRAFGPDELLIMADIGPDPGRSALAAVDTAVAGGAEILAFGDLGDTGAEIVAIVRERYPSTVISVESQRPEVVEAGADLLTDLREEAAEIATRHGTGLVCRTQELAERAVTLGVRRDGILLDAGPDLSRLSELVATGWPVLVRLPDEELVGTLATASVAAWLGARVYRTRYVPETRRALDMVATIRGTRLPAATRRALA